MPCSYSMGKAALLCTRSTQKVADDRCRFECRCKRTVLSRYRNGVIETGGSFARMNGNGRCVHRTALDAPVQSVLPAGRDDGNIVRSPP